MANEARGGIASSPNKARDLGRDSEAHILSGLRQNGIDGRKKKMTGQYCTGKPLHRSNPVSQSKISEAKRQEQEVIGFTAYSG